jgi:hypothetical protein
VTKKRFPHEIRSYVGVDLYERLLREAAARRLTVSECVRLDLAELYARRDRLQERLDSGAEATAAAEVEHRLLRLELMIDRFYLGVMMHLAEVPDGLRAARADSAEARYRSWVAAVEELAGGETAAAADQPTADPPSTERA